MGIFTNKKTGTAPHLWYPEILHWKEGDEIIARNPDANNWLSKLMAYETNKLNLVYYFKAITDSGNIIVEEKDAGVLHKIDFQQFVRHAKSFSLSNRTIHSNIDESKKYMELMKEFQKAYLELEDSDNQKFLK